MCHRLHLSADESHLQPAAAVSIMASAAFEPARAAAQLPAMCAEVAVLMKPNAGALEAVRTTLRRACVVRL